MLQYSQEYLILLKEVSKYRHISEDDPSRFADVPYLNYKAMEDIFSLYMGAKHVGRLNNSFDAIMNINGVPTGVGLKTFVCLGNKSSERISEFNSADFDWKNLNGIDLIMSVANARNARVLESYEQYGIQNSIYHIIARKSEKLCLFETPYNIIDTNNITIIYERKASIKFTDGYQNYIYSKTSHILKQEFSIPPENQYVSIPVEIITNPYEVILAEYYQREFDTNNTPTTQSQAEAQLSLPLPSKLSSHTKLNQKQQPQQPQAHKQFLDGNINYHKGNNSIIQNNNHLQFNYSNIKPFELNPNLKFNLDSHVGNQINNIVISPSLNPKQIYQIAMALENQK